MLYKHLYEQAIVLSAVEHPQGEHLFAKTVNRAMKEAANVRHRALKDPSVPNILAWAYVKEHPVEDLLPFYEYIEHIEPPEHIENNTEKRLMSLFREFMDSVDRGERPSKELIGAIVDISLEHNELTKMPLESVLPYM